MSFREKSAWISFISLLLAFGAYFGVVGHDLVAPGEHHPHYFILFAALVVAVVILEAVLHIIVAARSPSDAKSPRDEREKLIALKATRPAFYVLLVGSFLAIATMHLGAHVWQLAHAVLFAIWLAELTRFGTQIYLYRRGLSAR